MVVCHVGSFELHVRVLVCLRMNTEGCSSVSFQKIFSLSAVLDWDHAHDLIGRGYFPERMKSRFKRERQK